MKNNMNSTINDTKVNQDNEITYRITTDPDLTKGSVRVTIISKEQKNKKLILHKISPAFAYFNKRKTKYNNSINLTREFF